MPSFVPRVRWEVKPILQPMGTQPSNMIYEYRYDGLLASEGHFRLRNGSWSGGGPFYAHHESVTHGAGRTLLQQQWTSGGRYNPQGVVPAPVRIPVMPKPSIVDAFNEADGFGLSGYNRTRPGNPIADLFVFGKEVATDGFPAIPFGSIIRGKPGQGFLSMPDLREIPGRIRAALADYRNLGSQYLNGVFGWMPFVRDLRKLILAMGRMNEVMAKLIRENGKLIHRKAILHNEQTVSQTSQVYTYPFANVYGAPPNWGTGKTVYTVTTMFRKKVWYSAAYRYWIPDTSSLVWNAKAYLALAGALPTPGAVWSVMPWTWLTDWFANWGDIYDSLSPNAVDGLVQKYGYTMLNDESRTVWHAGVHQPYFHVVDSNGTRHRDAVDHGFSSTKKVERKIRVGGYNPFGPGLEPVSFSPGQLAILAALGLSKS